MSIINFEDFYANYEDIDYTQMWWREKSTYKRILDKLITRIIRARDIRSCSDADAADIQDSLRLILGQDYFFKNKEALQTIYDIAKAAENEEFEKLGLTQRALVWLIRIDYNELKAFFKIFVIEYESSMARLETYYSNLCNTMRDESQQSAISIIIENEEKKTELLKWKP